MKILHIDSSITQEASVSNQLTRNILKHLQQQYPDSTVVSRDVGVNPPAHLSLPVCMAVRSQDLSGLTEQQKVEVQEIHRSIQELKDADIIVIGAPMYNFTISGGLKAWTDQVCQAGSTFKYTEQGPQGLLQDKPVIIASARGGIHGSASDFEEPLLKMVLGLMGITNITVIRAEGVNMGPEQKQAALDAAHDAIALIK